MEVKPVTVLPVQCMMLKPSPYLSPTVPVLVPSPGPGWISDTAHNTSQGYGASLESLESSEHGMGNEGDYIIVRVRERFFPCTGYSVGI